MGLLIGVSGIISPKDHQSMQHRKVMKPVPPEQGMEGQMAGLLCGLDAPWTPQRLSFLTCKMGRQQFRISPRVFPQTAVPYFPRGFPTDFNSVEW